MVKRLLNGNGAQSAIISLVVGAAVVLGGWWQISAQIDKQINGKVGPVQKQVDELCNKVDRNTALSNQNNGMLRGIAARLLVEVPAPLPPAQP